MKYDATTLQFCSAVLLVVSASSLLMVRATYRQIRGVALWALGLALFSGALLLQSPEDIASCRGAAIVVLAGMLALRFGLERFDGSLTRLHADQLLVPTLVAVGATLLHFWQPAAVPRLIWAAAALTGLVEAQRVGIRQGDDRLLSRQLLAAGMAIIGLKCLTWAFEGTIDRALDADGALTALQTMIETPLLLLGVALVGLALPLLAVEHRQHVEARLAVTDELTDLPNRRGFLAATGRICESALSAGQPVSLLMMDLDGFSDINRRYGHPAGDRLLSAVAGAVKEGLRPVDLIGRVGGEEFCICLPGATLADARAVADRLRRRVYVTKADADGREISVSVSIGVAMLGPAGLAAAMKEADVALYAAKAQGRDRVCHSSASAMDANLRVA